MTTFTDFNTFIQSIRKTVEAPHPNLDDLDVLTAYYLGIATAAKTTLTTLTTTDTVLTPLYETVKALFEKKRGLKFIDRLTAIASSTAMTPATKEKVLDPVACPDPIKVIVDLNQVTGKAEATLKIKPFASRLQDPTFHQEFLEYEAKAHTQVVGGLIDRLATTVGMIRIKTNGSQVSKKNTLKNLYQPGNVGKTFVSVDLRQANWTALRHWDPSLPTWDVMIRSLLPNGDLKELFVTSKLFRQITLGVALKKYGVIPQIEATQVMLVRQLYNKLDQGIGEPFSESNDELIFEWKWRRDEIPRWFKPALNNPLFKVTIQTMVEHTYDDCYEFEYEEPGPFTKKYRLLRCYNPDKVEARLA